ncbi:hypothetical protein D6D01_01511 [Aureobasidium pullulans]|uniref:DUF7587 domain-containing protein n=1 Tax=Aureobasidium pullulans TaxID=5580 RepID=A0A4V4JY09_AURPU|nr:hypothetical protein D6D01_01511 [Aureobasidium pullulans]
MQRPITRATDKDLVISDPIRPEEAHSPVPVLLFRFYDDESQGVRGSAVGGELAQNFAWLTTNTPAPIPCDDARLFTTILNHINHITITSDLISTTSNLFFAIRLAAKSQATNPRISVFRSSFIPPQRIYHALPYHKRYKPLKLYYNGKFMNSSYHEYLVWAKIPETAYLCDFAFQDLERHLVGNPSMQAVLRIEDLRSKKSNPTLQKQFKNEDLELTLSLAEGLAKFLLHFGIDAAASSAVIARLVSETIRGFKVSLRKTTVERWDFLAGAFAYALTEHDGQSCFLNRQLVLVKEAFKTGIYKGLGDLNWHLDVNKRSAMLRMGRQKGLDPNVMLIDEAATSQTQADSGVVPNSPHTIIDLTAIADEMGDDHLTDEEEAETELEEDVHPQGPRLSQRMSRPQMVDKGHNRHAFSKETAGTPSEKLGRSYGEDEEDSDYEP